MATLTTEQRAELALRAIGRAEMLEGGALHMGDPGHTAALLRELAAAVDPTADCPGIELAPGEYSGCTAARTGASDCPTCGQTEPAPPASESRPASDLRDGFAEVATRVVAELAEARLIRWHPTTIASAERITRQQLAAMLEPRPAGLLARAERSIKPAGITSGYSDGFAGAVAGLSEAQAREDGERAEQERWRAHCELLVESLSMEGRSHSRDGGLAVLAQLLNTRGRAKVRR